MYKTLCPFFPTKRGLHTLTYCLIIEVCPNGGIFSLIPKQTPFADKKIPSCPYIDIPSVRSTMELAGIVIKGGVVKTAFVVHVGENKDALEAKLRSIGEMGFMGVELSALFTRRD